MKITCTSTSLNDNIPLTGRSLQKRGKNRYRILYSEVNTSQDADVQEMFDNFQAEISVSNPYDDAEYAWAIIKDGVIRIIKDGKVIAKEFYFNADDEDLENEEWCDIVINRALDALEKVNGKVKSRIIHNSTDIDVQDDNDAETGEDDFDQILEKYTGSSVPSNHVWSEQEFHKFMKEVANS